MYTKVESRFWQDEKMRDVSDEARYLMLYLLTSPHRNVLGFYFLPEPYACFDLGWTTEQFRERLEELLKKGLIKYDETAHVVLIKNFLKHNPLENQNQVKSAIKRLDEIPKTYLFKDFYEVVKKVGNEKKQYSALLEQLKKQLPERLDKQLDEPLDKQFSKQEEEKELLQKENSSCSSTITTGADVIVFDNEFSELAKLYQQVIGQPNGLTADWIKTLLNEYGFSWVKNAMLEAEKRGKRTKKYVEGILQNWKANGGMKLSRGDPSEKSNPKVDYGW